MYINQKYEELVLVESNVFEMLDRLKHILKDPSHVKYHNYDKDNFSSDEDSWTDSEEEKDMVCDDLDNLCSKQVTSIIRDSTYQQRKEKALNKINNEVEKSIGILTNSDSDSDFETEKSRNEDSEVLISINALGDEDKCNRNTQTDDQKTLKLLNNLLIPKNVNVNSNLFKNMTNRLLNNKTTDEMENIRKPIIVDDIVLENKGLIESKNSNFEIKTSILSLFSKNKASIQQKKGSSSIVQFLIDQNLWKESIKNYHNSNTPECTDDTNFAKFRFIQENEPELEYESTLSTRHKKKEFKKEVLLMQRWQKWTGKTCIEGSLCGFIDTITSDGKLMVMFASLMLLSNNIIDSTKVIEEFGFWYKYDKLSLANMHKLFGLIYLMEEARNESIKHFDKALSLFKKIGSIHGQAATYYLKSYSIRIEDFEDKYNNFYKNIESK